MCVFDGQQDRFIQRAEQAEHLDANPERRLVRSSTEVRAQPTEQVLHPGVR